VGHKAPAVEGEGEGENRLTTEGVAVVVSLTSLDAFRPLASASEVLFLWVN
jgi:hypothetical protein